MAKPKWEWPKKINLPKDYTILTIADFHRPPLATKGNKTFNAIHNAVGRSIMLWTMVETYLQHIFMTLTAPQGVGTSHAFESVTSLRDRTEMIDAAARVEIGRFAKQQLLSELLKRTELIRQASGRRNDVAHGIPTTRPTGCFVEPSRFAPPPKNQRDIFA